MSNPTRSQGCSPKGTQKTHAERKSVLSIGLVRS